MSGKSIRKMLSLRDLQHSQAQIAKELKVDPSTVSKWFKKADALKIEWEQVSQMSDEELEGTFNATRGRKPVGCHPVDVEAVADKVRRGKKVEDQYGLYCAEAAKSSSGLQPLSRAAFFQRIKKHREAQETKNPYSMLTVWQPRRYMQVDLAGDPIELKPDENGNPVYCYVLVAKLPSTSMNYAKAIPGKSGPDWCEGLVGALEYFNGRTDFILCDNDAALVAKATPGNQKLTKDFADFCQIYRIEVELARPGVPTDKAAVEAAVGRYTSDVIEQIKPRSLKTLEDVQRLLDSATNKMNTTVSARRHVSPWDDFMAREQKKLKELPKNLSWSRWGPRRGRVIDGSRSVRVDGHYYGVPHGYELRRVDVAIGRDQIALLRPGTNKLVAIYEHHEKGVGHPLEGFNHVKEEYRGPGELTDEAQLAKQMEKYASFGDNARTFAARFVAIRSNKSRRFVAQQLGFIHQRMKGMESEVVDQACSHALAMHDFDKDNFLIYLQASQKLFEKAAEALEKNKPTYKGACLRSNGAKVQYPLLRL